MLKIATLADLELIQQLANNFIESIEYSRYSHGKDVEEIIRNLLSNDRSIILLHGEDGMLAGTLGKFPFGPYTVASEIAWWVNPDKRKSNIGSELLEAFEYWAKKIGADMVQMSGLDDKVDKYYISKGYKLYERAYMKEL